MLRKSKSWWLTVWALTFLLKFENLRTNISDCLKSLPKVSSSPTSARWIWGAGGGGSVMSTDNLTTVTLTVAVVTQGETVRQRDHWIDRDFLVLLAYKYTSIFYILSVLAYWEYTKTHHLRNPAVEPSDPDLLMTVEVCGGWGCRSDSGPSSSSSKSDSHWF